jgi:hypothetical protein
LFWLYFISPIVIYFTHYHLAHPQYIPFEIEYARQQLPDSYYQHIDSLKALGFSPVAHLYNQGQAPNTTLFLTLFINAIQKDTAAVIQIKPALGTIAPEHYVEFSTEFADGSEVNTHNSRFPGMFSPLPEKEIYRMREIKDPYTLYKIHQYLLRKRPRAASILPSTGEEIDDFCRSAEKSLTRQVDMGYYYLDSTSQKYRPTLKGAFIQTWKLVWPIAAIRKFLENARNNKLIKPLNIC